MALRAEGAGLRSWGGQGRRERGGHIGLWSTACVPGGVRGLPAGSADPGPPGFISQLCHLLAVRPPTGYWNVLAALLMMALNWKLLDCALAVD